MSHSRVLLFILWVVTLWSWHIPTQAQAMDPKYAAPAQWDDPPKVGKMVLTFSLQGVSQNDLWELHQRVFPKLAKFLSSRQYAIVIVEKAPMVEISNKGEASHLRIELPKLSKGAAEELVALSAKELEQLLKDIKNSQPWKVYIISKEKEVIAKIEQCPA